MAWRLSLSIIALCFCLDLPAQAYTLLDGDFESLPGNASNWRPCQGQPDLQVIDGQGSGIFGIQVPAFEGQHYLGLGAAGGDFDESIGQAFELIGGEYYSGSLAAFKSNAHQSWTGSAHLEIWAGSGCEDLTEMLWASPSISNINEWRQFEFGFAPVRSHRWLTVMAVLDQGANGMAYLCIDDLQLVYSVLQFEFLQVHATQIVGGLDLQWQTAALAADLRFEVQARVPGQPFLKLGELEAQAGQSAFNLQLNMPPQSALDIRLVAIEANGSRQYSETIALTTQPLSSIQAWPNPTTGNLNLLLPEELGENVVLELYDYSGRLVWTLELTETLNLSTDLPKNLVAGQYHLVAKGKGRQLTKKLNLLPN